jgi:inosose dehydratase
LTHVSTAPAPDALRACLRRPGGVLADSPVGAVPILWNNVDVAELRSGSDPDSILDEIARLGYDGCQFGLGFPTGAALRTGLARRGLALAEVYASLPCEPGGPLPDSLQVGLERLAILHEGGGEVLCAALDVSPGRSEASGHAADPGTPVLTETGWRRLAAVIDALAAEATSAGHRLAFHPHAGTYVETPAEVARFAAATDPATVGICVDVGHALVGGTDPVTLIETLGPRVTHVHLKDVDGAVLDRLRTDPALDFHDAIRARLFTELGAGRLDLIGVLTVLHERGYQGWLMVEQDSSWGPASEAAAIGRRVLATALETIGRRGDLEEIS